MKYILRIILIIILMIGIYTYAYVNRYRVFMSSGGLIIKYDSWIDKTLAFDGAHDVWLELNKEEKGWKERGWSGGI